MDLNGVPAPPEQMLDSWLVAEQKGWQEIEGLVARITPEQASVVGYMPGWSVKDLLAHLAGWFAEAGMELERTEPSSGDSDLSIDEKNEIFVEANRDQPLPVVLGEAVTARNRMLRNLRSLGRIPQGAEEAVHKAGPDHYLEHAARLQQWVSELHGNPGFENRPERPGLFPKGNAPDPKYAGRLV